MKKAENNVLFYLILIQTLVKKQYKNNNMSFLENTQTEMCPSWAQSLMIGG